MKGFALGLAAGIAIAAGIALVVVQAGVLPPPGPPQPSGSRCDGGGRSNVAIFATGQTKCYDVEGEETAYNDSNYPGQDAVYDTGAKRSYRENGDGTVTDNVTNPMWANSPSPHPMTWQEALKRCESLTLAGHSDWRVPNTNELQSLVLYDRAYAAPCIDPVFDFPTGPQDWWYRSSFSDIFVPRGAWVVYSGYGNVVVNDEADDVRVRTVRGGA